MVDAAQQVVAAKEPVSDFDAFLSSPNSEEQQTAANPFASDLFPGMDEDFANSSEQSPTPETTDSPFGKSEEAFANTSESSSLDVSFDEATSKHGFTPTSKRDPWAAFEKLQAAVSPSTPENASTSDGFSWGQQSEANQLSESPADFAAMNSDHSVSFNEASHGSSFLQVSSSRQLDAQPPIDISDTPLVIPGPRGNGPEIWSDSAQQTSPRPQIANDPFLTSVPDFAEPESDITGDAATAPATAAMAPGGIGQWSRRTWFLLIGCIIVALLLFMPDRQNRTNV